jgi:hypothetical protein
MNPRNRAAELLTHYLRMACPPAMWNHENDAEAAEIVDAIIEAAATKTAEMLATRHTERP